MVSRKKTKRATLKDVAAAANVSIMTVSNVVNGRYWGVSERTRKVVEREIKNLNYRATSSARALRTGETRSVGVILTGNPLDDVFGASEVELAFRALAANMGDQGYSITMRSQSGSSPEGSLKSLDGNVDAFVVLSFGGEAPEETVARIVAESSKPTVVVGASPSAGPDDVCAVHDASRGAGNDLSSLLATNKLDRIVVFRSKFVSPQVKMRIDGVVAGASRNGIEVVDYEHLMNQDFVVDRQIMETIDGAPGRSCIITLNEAQAQMIVLHLARNGKSVPDYVQLASVNLGPGKPYRYPDGSGRFYSPITGIWSDSYRMGTSAASILMGRLKQGAFKFKSVEVGCTINEGSTALRMSSEPQVLDFTAISR